jgi:TPR repeat protein
MSLNKLKAFCFRKDSNSCNIIANWYSNQQDKQKNALKESKTYYQLSCSFGNPKGCFYVGNFYYTGQVGLKIKKAAIYYFEVSCLGGYSDACFELGMIYSIGKNVYLTADKALYYFKKSCYLGNENGCLNYKLISKSLNR